MSSDEEKRARARAAWRAWYRRKHEEAKEYYRLRYAEKMKTETVEAREIRLAKARVAQKAYANRKKNLKG